MKIVALVIALLGLNSMPVLGQTIISKSENRIENSYKVIRYVTDIKRVSEDSKIISVNVLFHLNDSNDSGTFNFIMPEAEKVKVANYTMRIYDVKGDLINKGKKKKPSMDDFSSFNPSFVASKFLGSYSKPLMVEWDFKLIVTNPKGNYKWPSIGAGNNQFEELSLRLNFENPEDFEFTTNMDVSQEKDMKSGGYFYLWSIKKLTPKGGEFNGVNVSDPNVIISFK